MVHPRICFRRQDRLRAVGDAQAGPFQHIEIVGPVAHRNRLGGRKAVPGGLLLDGGQLGLPAQDRLGNARQAAVLPQ